MGGFNNLAGLPAEATIYCGEGGADPSKLRFAETSETNSRVLLQNKKALQKNCKA